MSCPLPSPFEPFWCALQRIDADLSQALAEHQEEVQRLAQQIEARATLASHLGRTDLVEQLEGLRRDIAILSEVAQKAFEQEVPKEAEQPAEAPSTPEEPVAAPTPVEEPSPSPALPPEVSEPAPVVETPKRISAKPTSRQGVKELKKRQTSFFDRERRLLETERSPQGHQYAVRELICEARGLIEQAETLGEPVNVLEESLRELKSQQQGAFFGLNQQRHHKPDQWFEIAEAYRLLADCDETLAWTAITDLGQDDRRELIDCLAAANSLLPRINFDRGVNIADNDQEKQFQEVKKVNGNVHFIRWWNFNEDAPPLESLKARARELAPLLARFKERTDKQSTREQAKASLDSLLQAIEDDTISDDFVEDLRELVRSCLVNGVRPSDKSMVDALFPYRHHLRNLGCPHASQFENYLQKKANSLVTQRQRVVDSELPFKLGDVDMAVDLRNALKGKAVLMLGGRHDNARVNALRDALGCEVEWPDSTDDTKIETFRAAVDRSDIVCRFIRWSRHNYKDVLDWATEQGKPTVTFKAGSGVNRVIHDMAKQLQAAEPVAG